MLIATGLLGGILQVVGATVITVGALYSMLVSIILIDEYRTNKKQNLNNERGC